MTKEMIDRNTKAKETSQDMAQLIARGNKLASSLEELTSEPMQKAVPNLLGLQWWEFAKQRTEAWKMYIRVLERDGVI